MAENGRVGIGDGGDDALRLLRAAKAEAAMHAGDDKIKALQHVRRIIERAIGENVGFDAFEDAEASAIAAVERFNDLVLSFDLFQLEAARVVSGLGVVSDAKISITALARGIGHLLQGVRAVREVGVQVKHAAKVFHRDELRKSAFACARDLVGAFAQFRRNEGKAERGVYIPLSPGAYVSCAATQAARPECDPHFSGGISELRNVALAAGGVQEHRAETAGGTGMKRDGPELLFRGLSGFRFGGNEPEIGDQLAAASQIARDGDLTQRRTKALQFVSFLVEDGLRLVHAKAPLTFARDLKALPDLAFKRAAEPLGFRDLPVPAGSCKFLERGYAQKAVQLEDDGRAQAGNAEHGQQPGGKLRPHALQRLVRAAPIKRLDSLCDRSADAGNGFQRPFPD